MRKKFNFLLYTTGVSLGLSLGLISKAPAVAFTVTPNNDANSLLSNLLGNTDGLSNFTTTLAGVAQAFGIFQDDPFNLESGIVLSTGDVTQLPGENTTDNNGSELSTVFGTPGNEPNTFDQAQLDITFNADTTRAQNIFFQYVFGSEEFLEFGGTGFNDSFELLLNGVNLALLTNGSLVTINNLVSNPAGPYNADYIDNPAAPGTLTRLDGFTQTLIFQGQLRNGANTLSISIKDVGDASYDSAVFLKGGTFGVVIDPAATDVPEPGSLLGLLAVSAFGIASTFKPNKKN